MSRTTLYFIYSLPAAPLGMMFVLYLVYAPKSYVDFFSLSAGAVSGLLLLSRVWDAFLDPIIGITSDRTISRFGRRKIFIILGLLPTSVLALAVFTPVIVSNSILLYFSTLLLFFFYSSCAIPYEAWGVDLCSTSSQRTEMSMWREASGIMGVLLALAIPATLTFYGEDMRDALTVTLLAVILLLVICFVVALYFIPEAKKSQQIHPWQLKDAVVPFRNFNFNMLLLAFLLTGIGSAVAATLFLFYIEQYLQSDKGPIFLLLYFFSGVISLPVWLKLSKSWSKKSTWIGSLFLNSLAFSLIFLVSPGQLLLYGIFVFLSGLGFGASLALPASIQIDIIEEHSKSSDGVRSEGQFFGLWSLTRKISAALGASLSLYILSFYEAAQGSDEHELYSIVIRNLYVILPTIFMMLACIVAYFIRISDEGEVKI